jgi:hypothetical protein
MTTGAPIGAPALHPCNVAAYSSVFDRPYSLILYKSER